MYTTVSGITTKNEDTTVAEQLSKSEMSVSRVEQSFTEITTFTHFMQIGC